MSFKRFCVKCGKETSALISGLCRDCFLKTNDLFDLKEGSIERCVKCGRTRIKGKWVGCNIDAIANEVASKVRFNPAVSQSKVFVELNPVSDYEYKLAINVKGLIGEIVVEQSKEFKLNLLKVSCDDCMKLVSNYREAVIQLRSSSNKETEPMLEVTKQLLLVEAMTDPLSSVIKILRGPTGFDLWVCSNKSAARVVRKLSRLYKVTPKVSKKLIGVKNDGAEKYRVTYCIKK